MAEIAAAADLPPRTILAELEDPRMAETWLRVMERNARAAKRQADEHARKHK